MNIKNIVKLTAVILLAAVFVLLGYMLVQVPALHYVSGITAEFSKVLWNERRLDVMLQVMLIFTCSMGILVFFSGKEGK
jgi:hypothetical protein